MDKCPLHEREVILDGATTVSITTVSLTTVSIKTLNIKGLSVPLII
jgi:hypothetical protein